jgi:hypothetical protein
MFYLIKLKHYKIFNLKIKFKKETKRNKKYIFL